MVKSTQEDFEARVRQLRLIRACMRVTSPQSLPVLEAELERVISEAAPSDRARLYDAGLSGLTESVMPDLDAMAAGIRAAVERFEAAAGADQRGRMWLHESASTRGTPGGSPNLDALARWVGLVVPMLFDGVEHAVRERFAELAKEVGPESIIAAVGSTVLAGATPGRCWVQYQERVRVSNVFDSAHQAQLVAAGVLDYLVQASGVLASSADTGEASSERSVGAPR